MEKINFLKERAREFFERALEDFEKKRYNLCAFDLEQSLQLFLKYLIAKKVGEWPQTHYLIELLERLVEVYEKKEIFDFYKNNELFFDDLSEAYFTSRYYPRTFRKEVVEKLIEKTKEFISFLEEKINEKFNSDK